MKVYDEKYVHDVKSALRSFEVLVKLLKSGYRFQDDEASDIIKRLETSCTVLSVFIQESLASSTSKP